MEQKHFKIRHCVGEFITILHRYHHENNKYVFDRMRVKIVSIDLEDHKTGFKYWVTTNDKGFFSVQPEEIFEAE